MVAVTRLRFEQADKEHTSDFHSRDEGVKRLSRGPIINGATSTLVRVRTGTTVNSSSHFMPPVVLR